MPLDVPGWAGEVVAGLEYPAVFATVSGAHHLGFATGQEKLFAQTGQLKPALYTLRVLLTGQHLMRTGELETDLNVLGARLPYVPDLIARKRDAEHGPFPADARAALDRDVPRLRTELEEARDASTLPEQPSPTSVDALHDLVIRTRLDGNLSRLSGC